jgi:aldose 1-epimerase
MTGSTGFGEVDGRPAHLIELDGGEGVRATLTDYGARLVALHVPDRAGRTADVVLGFDDLSAYVATGTFMGGTVGRYGNRIGGARFTLFGVEHRLDANEGRHQLHGGSAGWERRLWDVEPDDGRGVRFSFVSPDGDMGYPGTCRATCTYLLEGSVLRVVMEATTDAPTVVNMVHHSYWNLAGHDSGTVLEHRLRVPARFVLPVDEELIPTGEVAAVEGSALDLRDDALIGDRLEALARSRGEQPADTRGFDQCWCLGVPGADGLVEAAELVDPGSGRRLRIRSTEPGLQVYTGGYLHEGVVGKGATPYQRFSGICLETQRFPDSPNLGHLPSTLLLPGRRYHHELVLDLTP